MPANSRWDLIRGLKGQSAIINYTDVTAQIYGRNEPIKRPYAKDR